MTISAHCTVQTTANSYETGRSIARELKSRFTEPPRFVLTYLTINHAAADYLRGLGEVLGPEVPVLGCSAQGVVGLGKVQEDGFAAGVMALGGRDLQSVQGCVEDIPNDTYAKGEQLGRQLLSGKPGFSPRLVILHYDGLCGVEINEFLQGLHSVVQCDIVGGAAAHSFNYTKLLETYQYCGQRVLTRAAVAVALAGEFHHFIDRADGCAPVGVELTVTRSEGTLLLELDGKPATQAWEQIAGTRDSPALAIGVPISEGSSDFFVRAAYRSIPERGGVVLGTEIPVGTRIMLHHRSVEDVVDGTRAMAARLRAAMAGRSPRAVFCFECGARTRPFLGDEATLEENLELQTAIGREAAWLGMLPWGEILPIAGRPTFHNYSFPTLVLTD